mmetsp:Transcript_48469/g.90278  ORF Transcript_48469/g.90278 Transcript_48469/m.90278 type:complete len:537 (+) Transcript_48469:128-1738(+)
MSYVFDKGLMADQTTGELTLESVAKYAQETAILAKASEEHMNEMQDWLDILWLLLGSYLVFFMQAGFALLEAGSVRSKNTKNILLKNVLDACLGAAVWWLIGYPFAFGGPYEQDDRNPFIGAGTNFAMADRAQASGSFYATWMFQWAFAATAGTIVSGAVAERCDFRAYLVYTCIITGIIYPVVAHWGWSSEGWLSPFREPSRIIGGNGLIDFGGSAIVHMGGGGAALMASIFLGPRLGRFDVNGDVVDMPGHSTVLAALGTFILWFGWYGFNPCSTLAIKYMNIAQRVAVTTTLSAAAGGSTCLGIHVALGNPPDVSPALNGILAGLVGITAACPVVQPWVSYVIGMIAAPIYMFSSHALKKLRIDDPLDAAPVHFCCGAWGLISVGLFADKELTASAYGTYMDGYGVFMGGDGVQLGVQLVALVAIASWSCGTSAILFAILKHYKILRVDLEDEIKGLDLTHHGGSAYTFAVNGGSFNKHGGPNFVHQLQQPDFRPDQKRSSMSEELGAVQYMTNGAATVQLAAAPGLVVPDAF